MPKRCQNDAKMIPKWPQSDPGSTPKMVQNHPKITPKWSKITPKWSYFGPKMVQRGAIITPDRVKNGLKGDQRWPKTVQSSSRPSSNCIKTPKMHSGPFQTYPLAAHVHRLKRRFWPFFKQNKCFIGEKGLVFFFCTILHSFREFWQNFAYFCLLLHHFA